jgi:diguanylate cyclase (GGDEF)-like protein
MESRELIEDHDPAIDESPRSNSLPDDDRETSLPLGSDPTAEIHRTFWLRHIRIGFSVFLGETLLVMLYLFTTPGGSHRLLLICIASSWFGFAVAGILAAPRLASLEWRVAFSASWSIASAVAVGLAASLDGGLGSPLLFLLFLPIGFASLAYTPRITFACGASALGTLGVVAAIDPKISISLEYLLVLAGVMVGAAVLSIAASINRTKRELHERMLSEEVALLASTDGLTRCAVHRVFHRRLEEEIGRSVRSNHPLSLMMIDVDDFKAVNDTYGHVVGDHVLASIGWVLCNHTRNFEMVGRLGGDEFAVLLPETDPSAAVIVAERLRHETSKKVEVPVTLSIGVSGVDQATPTAERMLDDADLALYQVKHAGRDGVAVSPLWSSTPKKQRGRATA